MTDLQIAPTETPLPTPSVPVPSVTNQRLLRSLPGAGLFRDRVKQGEFSPDDLPALRVLEAELVVANEPAKAWDAAAVIERLFAHYPRPDLPDSAAATRLDDWYDDLEGLPLPVIQATARDWRRSAAKFAPTPGQFLEKAKRYAEPHRVGLGLCRLLIKALEGPQ
jgi:hypothetical protein